VELIDLEQTKILLRSRLAVLIRRFGLEVREFNDEPAADVIFEIKAIGSDSSAEILLDSDGWAVLTADYSRVEGRIGKVPADVVEEFVRFIEAVAPYLGGPRSRRRRVRWVGVDGTVQSIWMRHGPRIHECGESD
jgi:hypothetical protein